MKKVYFQNDIEAIIAAGLLLAIESNGGQDTNFLRGILAMGRHQCQAVGGNWQAMVKSLGLTAGVPMMELLDVIDAD